MNKQSKKVKSKYNVGRKDDSFLVQTIFSYFSILLSNQIISREKTESVHA